MAKCRKEDRVKEGRTRIGLIMDDDILKAVDMLAQHEGESRAKMLNVLILNSLRECGYDDMMRKYQEAFEYWARIWSTRPSGFLEKSKLFPWVEQEELDCNCDPDNYADHEWREEMLRIGDRQSEIHKEYSELWKRIEEDKCRAQQELEQKYNSLKNNTNKGR